MQVLDKVSGVRVISGDPIAAWEQVEEPLKFDVKNPVKEANPELTEKQRKQKTYGLSLWMKMFFNPKTQLPDEFVSVKKDNGGTVLAILETGEVLLVEQFKQAKGVIALECVAFMPKEGSDLATSALEELKSEAGVAAGTFDELAGGNVWLAARKIDTEEATYVATGCRVVGNPQQDKGEIIRVYAVTQEALWGLIDDGTIRTAGTLAAIFRAHRAGYLDNAVYQKGMKQRG